MRILYILTFALVFIVFPQVSNAQEITVTDTNSLTDALQKAEQGDTIVLLEGVYQGTFIIDKSIHLKGIGDVWIKGLQKGNVLTIQADNVMIENLIITGSGSSGAGIFITSNQNQILNTHIEDVFHGIQIKNSYGNRIEGNTIASYTKPTEHKGYGIYLIEADQTRVLDNHLSTLQDGVYISYSNYVELQNNTIKNARYGFHTMDSKYVSIYGNEVRESHNGSMIMQSYDVYIRNNFFHLNTTGNGTGIFVFDTFDSNFSQNYIKGNYRGIYLENASRNTIQKNQLEQNMKGLELGEKSNQNRIFANNFIKNTQQVVTHPANKNQFSVEGIGNYWEENRIVDLDEDHINDFAYKSGDVFYAMTTKESLYQLFVASPAIQLWNMIEQYTPIPADTFIIDEHPLTKAVHVDIQLSHQFDGYQNSTQAQTPITSLILFLTVSIISMFLLFITRRKAL